MSNENIKVIGGNGIIFGLSFTNIESGMRLFLLALSIIYTSVMIYKLITKNNDTNK
jgi:hypothetical protein